MKFSDLCFISKVYKTCNEDVRWNVNNILPVIPGINSILKVKSLFKTTTTCTDGTISLVSFIVQFL